MILMHKGGAVIWLVFVILCNSQTSFAQRKERDIKLYPTVGATWRSTATYLFNFNGLYPYDIFLPYDYESNVQGASFTPGFQFLVKDRFVLEYSPGLRYDETHTYFDRSELVFRGFNDNGDSLFIGKPKIAKQFLVDHNFNLSYKWKSFSYGIGVTIVNAGASYYYNDARPPHEIRRHDIEFVTYNALVTIFIKKIFNLEMKTLYIPAGFPSNPEDEVLMLSFRVYYKFDFLYKRR
jgi:hypothetical protein